MAIKISIAVQKGGVGKTTTAINLADALHKSGYKVLIIDVDPQHNASDTYGAYTDFKESGAYTLANIMKDECSAEKAIQHMPMGEIIAGDIRLEYEMPSLINEPSRETIIKRAIKKLNKEYDFIIFDVGPSINIYTMNALCASDYVIIPVTSDSYSISGVGQFLNTVDTIKKTLNKKLKVLGILRTMQDKKTVLSRGLSEAKEEIEKNLNVRVFKTEIHKCQDIGNVQSIPLEEDSEGNIIIPDRSIYTNYRSSLATEEYLKFTNEVLEVLNGSI